MKNSILFCKILLAIVCCIMLIACSNTNYSAAPKPPHHQYSHVTKTITAQKEPRNLAAAGAGAVSAII